ncbi:hypothetical protein K439DRAFT_1368357, partial [Ramaria rubella]
LIDYLEEHPDFWQKLFLDATKEANAEGQKKYQSKDQKTVAHATLASWIFDDANEGDEMLWKSYVADKQHYAKSVGGQLMRLKKKYQCFCHELGETGSGLQPKDVTSGSQIENEIG